MTSTYADAHASLVQTLDARVREVVRRDGVDPQAEALVVRRIAEDVVRAHDERSLTGQVAPVPDPQAIGGEIVARVSGFGPLQPYLDDPSVEEVWINDPSQVFIARRGRHELTNTVLSAAEVTELVERMLKSSGRRLDISTPFVDAMLPEGHRLHVVLEGVSRGFTAIKLGCYPYQSKGLTHARGRPDPVLAYLEPYGLSPSSSTSGSVVRPDRVPALEERPDALVPVG